jgi:hypothetical protein
LPVFQDSIGSFLSEKSISKKYKKGVFSLLPIYGAPLFVEKNGA